MNNWEINKITLRDKNFKSTTLKIKSIKKMGSAEWENEKLPRVDWGEHLQAYWVELEGKITLPNNEINNENKIRVLGRSYKEIDQNWVAHSNIEMDAFYFFVNKLGEETEIPFRNIVYNNARDINNRKLFFRLSDSKVNNGASGNKEEINDIIKKEKQKWDNLGYKGSKELTQENKVWVDKGVNKEYKIAFQETDLNNNPAEVKNWQDTENKTELNASQAAIASKKGWLSNEVDKKMGSLDNGQSFSYNNVLTLQKSELQKFMQQLTAKIQQVVTVLVENKRELLTELERIRNDWKIGVAEQKAVLVVNEGKLDEAIDKLKVEKENTNTQVILTTDPQTGNGWNPPLTDEEKEVIKDSDLNNQGAIQAAAMLLSILRKVRNDNDGPGNLIDWNTNEKIKQAIKSFQEDHYNNLLPYWQQATTDSDQGKAWKTVNSNLNKVAENIYEHYLQLKKFLEEKKDNELKKSIEVLKQKIAELENKNKDLKTQLEQTEEKNTKLKQEKTELEQLKKAVHEALDKVYNRWNRAVIIERGKENEVLGDKWAERLQEKKTIQEVQEEQIRLIKKVDEEENKEKQNQVRYETEIQAEIDKAQVFIKNFNLTVQDSHKLVEELRNYRNWGNNTSPPAQQHAFSNKKNALNESIKELQVKIRCVEAIRLTTDELKDSENIGKSTHFPLETYDLENKYNDFAHKLRQMNNENDINDYENNMIKAIVALRPAWSDSRELIKKVEELLDKDNNSQSIQENREKIFEFLLDLEKYRSPQASEMIKLIYSKRQHDINHLINRLLNELRGQARTRLNEKRELLVIQGISVNQTIFENYRGRIGQANSRELQNQRYENEFLTKVLENQQTKIVQPPNK